MRRALLAFLFLTAPAFAKSLHWSAVDVAARMDRDGNLNIVERQSIVFDGDWNGGERDFNVRPGQTLEINSIKRVEGTFEVSVIKGNLSSIDHWDYAGNGVVRWRSRMPGEAPFDNRQITYILDVTYGNILTPASDEHRYTFKHDFGMPKRDGLIQRFTLHLEFDPVWNQPPVTIEQTDMPPGATAIVERVLTFTGTGEPAGVLNPLPWIVPIAAFLVFAAIAAILVFSFIGGERSVGRLAPVPARFDDELLSMPAEVAGAVWDAGVGAAEVAAVLARMTKEGKLSTRVEKKKLHMRLLVDRETLHGYEIELIDALFRSGEEETDTDAVRERYKSSGFDPAKKIRPGIEQQLSAIPGWDEKVKRFRGLPDFFLILGSLALLLASALLGPIDLPAGIVSFFAVMFFSIFGAVFAFSNSRAVAGLRGAFAGPAILMTLASVPFFVITLLARSVGIHGPVLFAIALWTLAWIKLVLDLLKIRDTPAKIAYRKRVAGARLYFIEQLRQPQPALRDEWFPYVLAFGLGSNVDRWFRAHGETTSSATMSSYSSSSSSSSSSGSASSWTGGGGAYGGAGATGSWAIAAGAMAAGVSAPSSSSSGGGGGGGSSSGGGGGGGW